MADSKQAEIIAKQAAEMRPRILQSFKNCPDGAELADGLIAIIKYFSAIAYWRGYKHAKKHYAALNSVKRTPDGRREVRRAIEQMLEREIDMTTKEICAQLDKLGLSASFDLEPKQKLNRKRNILHIGPRLRSVSWLQACDAGCVKQMISRIRTRLRKERRAQTWMALSQRALPKPQDTKPDGNAAHQL